MSPTDAGAYCELTNTEAAAMREASPVPATSIRLERALPLRELRKIADAGGFSLRARRGKLTLVQL